jgi:hypothetical protein
MQDVEDVPRVQLGNLDRAFYPPLDYRAWDW